MHSQQRGRLRQFHQSGVEALAARSLPAEDAELIDLAVRFLTLSGVDADALRVRINSLGGGDELSTYVPALRSHLENKRNELSPTVSQLNVI